MFKPGFAKGNAMSSYHKVLCGSRVAVGLLVLVVVSGCATQRKGDGPLTGKLFRDRIETAINDSYTNLTAYKAYALPGGVELPIGTVVRLVDQNGTPIIRPESVACTNTFPLAFSTSLGTSLTIEDAQLESGVEVNQLLRELGLASVGLTAERKVFAAAQIGGGNLEVVGDADFQRALHESDECTKALAKLEGKEIFVVQGRVFTRFALLFSTEDELRGDMRIEQVLAAVNRSQSKNIFISKSPEPNGHCVALLTKLELDPIRKMVAVKNSAKKKQLAKKAQKKPSKGDTKRILRAFAFGTPFAAFP